MSRSTAIRAVFRKASGLALLNSLAATGASLASEEQATHPPVAINAWTGVGMFYLHQSDPFGSFGGLSLAARVAAMLASGSPGNCPSWPLWTTKLLFRMKMTGPGCFFSRPV